jgi:hypothetical protein
MRLLNTNSRIPGGWRYEQFDANGKSLHKWSNNFDPWVMFLGIVRNFRVANHLPRPGMDEVESDVTEYIAREFGGDPKYFTLDPGQKKTSFTSRFQSRSAKLAGTIKKLFTGEEVIREWIGDGLKPVSTFESQNRADVCLGTDNGVPCPHNQPGPALIEEAALWVKLISEKKNDMKLTVIGEEKLQSCNLCLCPLGTKVHVPTETILSKTPKSMIEKFASEAPQNCWMRKPNNPA